MKSELTDDKANDIMKQFEAEKGNNDRRKSSLKSALGNSFIGGNYLPQFLLDDTIEEPEEGNSRITEIGRYEIHEVTETEDALEFAAFEKYFDDLRRGNSVNDEGILENSNRTQQDINSCDSRTNNFRPKKKHHSYKETNSYTKGFLERNNSTMDMTGEYARGNVKNEPFLEYTHNNNMYYTNNNSNIYFNHPSPNISTHYNNHSSNMPIPGSNLFNNVYNLNINPSLSNIMHQPDRFKNQVRSYSNSYVNHNHMNDIKNMNGSIGNMDYQTLNRSSFQIYNKDSITYANNQYNNDIMRPFNSSGFYNNSGNTSVNTKNYNSGTLSNACNKGIIMNQFSDFYNDINNNNHNLNNLSFNQPSFVNSDFKNIQNFNNNNFINPNIRIPCNSYNTELSESNNTPHVSKPLGFKKLSSDGSIQTHSKSQMNYDFNEEIGIGLENFERNMIKSYTTKHSIGGNTSNLSLFYKNFQDTDQTNQGGAGNQNSTKKLKSSLFNQANEIFEVNKKSNDRLPNINSQIHEFIATQKGSRTMQKLLEKTSPENVNLLLQNLKDHFAYIMQDTYGNYFFQKLIQCCTSEQRIFILTNIKHDFCDISLNASGSHSLQSMIELINIQEEGEIILSSIKGNVLKLSFDSNATHVIQKLILCINESNRSCLNDEIFENFHKFVKDSNGICVIKKFIKKNQSEELRKLFLDYISKNVIEIVQNPFGNYVIQFIIEEWGYETVKYTLVLVLKNIVSLSMQKFSSNVVEKILLTCENVSEIDKIFTLI